MTELLTPTVEYVLRDGRPRRISDADAGVVRADLHCHSTASDERLRFLPGLVFHPLLTPGEVYDLAKARGMDFVTLTDHDTIDGCLRLLEERGPLPDFIVGEEVSVAFPGDGTVIHVNVYDIDESQHREIQRVRGNLFEFVSYVRSIDKLYVLNHMTWNGQHRVLSTEQIELMLEQFPVFEGINGTRSYAHNAFTWFATRGRGKVLVAGSDSHTHRVGTTYTLSRGGSAAELLANIRAGVAEPCGAWGTAEKLREDVWLTLQRNVERRMSAAGSAWERGCCRVVRRLGQLCHPLVCLGYSARQNTLIRDFARALPA
jgi:predicted metal-dependent phosphoesterase TrpH